jgi:hypothetical protein
LTSLAKKYPKVSKDLRDAIQQIETDYSRECYAVAISGFNRMVWEYSYGSTDLNRGPRKSFRVIGVFLGETEGGSMYFILTFFKGDKASESDKTIEKAIERLGRPPAVVTEVQAE